MLTRICGPLLFSLLLLAACGTPPEDANGGDNGSSEENGEGNGGATDAGSQDPGQDGGGGGGNGDSGTPPTGSDAGGPAAPDAGPPAEEPPGLVGVTEAHNVARAEKGVPPLVWDPELAAVAQAWADACIDETAPAGLVDHNDGRSDNYPGYVGENIYGSSGSASGVAAVSSWLNEEQYYDYDSNSCSHVCGHYTQVMWAASTKLGCGINVCEGLTYSGTIVCNYSPGGNSGGRPY
jgi:uncharacterized protein YkwD